MVVITACVAVHFASIPPLTLGSASSRYGLFAVAVCTSLLHLKHAVALSSAKGPELLCASAPLSETIFKTQLDAKHAQVTMRERYAPIVPVLLPPEPA